VYTVLKPKNQILGEFEIVWFLIKTIKNQIVKNHECHPW
jgi:hypothetical protein